MAKFKNLSKSQKIFCLFISAIFVLILSIGIPSLARFKNRITPTISSWDGSIANSYKEGTGTSEDPYVISNGSELAYLSQELLTKDYQDTYFILENNIILNDGVFEYIDNNITYKINDNTYYINDTNYYSDASMRELIGTINTITPLNNFKGFLNGNSYTIYGLYMNDLTTDLALFTDLSGTVKDLYVENSFIHGGAITGGLATTTNNATLNNILFNGNVVGQGLIDKTDIKNIEIESIPISDIETTIDIDLSQYLPVYNTLTSTKIKGSYTTLDTSTIKINDTTITGGIFEIDLQDKTTLSITTHNPLEIDNLQFSNVTYEITYDYALTGGIVALSENSQITNVINKANIYGEFITGGLVGKLVNSSINSSYNNGLINSRLESGIASGIAGLVEDNLTNISKVYNTKLITGNKSSGLLGIIKNSNFEITDSFNASDNYAIESVIASNITILNSYNTYDWAINNSEINTEFINTTLDNLYNKDYLINQYNEFVSFDDLNTNPNNIWVYEKDNFPILYIDDILNPQVNLHASIYSWNNYSPLLESLKINSSFAFSIENINELSDVKEKYYYLSPSKQPLSKEELESLTEWIPYTDIVTIDTEGLYVIYVKVISNDSTVSYVNSDLLILDLSGSSVDITLDDTNWNTFKTDLSTKYIGSDKNLSITATDHLSGINRVDYYISDTVLSEEDLKNLPEESWNNYQDGVVINTIGKYIIYARAIDNSNYITYINTDYIVYDGYISTTTIDNSNLYITNDSSVTFNIEYDSNLNGTTESIHVIKSSILLPKNTNLTLINHIDNKIYEYKITTDEDLYNYHTSCTDTNCTKTATYPLTLFKEKGIINEQLFVENGNINKENFTLIIDFKDAVINNDYTNATIYLELNDHEGNLIRPTLTNSIKPFTITSSDNLKASLYLKTTNTDISIVYNSDSKTDISITSGLNYKQLNGNTVIDNSFKDKKIGLAIRLLDSSGSIVTKDYMQNLIFKIDDQEYYPSDDNIVRIPFNDISNVNKNVSIITNQNSSHLTSGTYYFKISNYVSFDGYYYDNLGSEEITIPVVLTSQAITLPYSFDVVMEDTDLIIKKSEIAKIISFKTLYEGELANPNIKVSLYKKDELTAYNQNYSLVDLQNYVSDSLNKYIDNIYYMLQNPINTSTYQDFSLNLITNNFENTGYRFVFDLYDGTKKVGTVVKNFIVK